MAAPKLVLLSRSIVAVIGARLLLIATRTTWFGSDSSIEAYTEVSTSFVVVALTPVSPNLLCWVVQTVGTTLALSTHAMGDKTVSP